VKDPHIHAEKTLTGLGQAEMRDLITRVTGLAGSLPKTCGTWCGLRRPLSATSKDPARVTCLACRDAAAADFGQRAGSGETLLGYPLSKTGLTPEKAAVIRDEAARCRELAVRFRA
jgi:hypothetical protein